MTKLKLNIFFTVFFIAVALAGTARCGEAVAEAGSEYDVLPMRYADMNKYDKIAMEPFRNRYDSMSVAEKAEVYSKQFEYMRNRKPNFDPAILNSMDALEESKAATSAFDAKRHLYKPAVPKKRRPRPTPAPEPPPQPAERQPANLLEALPGPWESMAPPEPPPEPEPPEPEFEEEFIEEPSGPEYPDDHLRLENLRRGWDAVDVLRGRRRR